MKKINFKKISDVMFKMYLGFVGIFITSALSTQIFFLYLQFTGQQERITDISNKVSWKIDGTFKNNPDNIWYEGPAKK
jgi:hypothetical protein